MATNFPAIEPTARRFVPPKWPVSGVRSQSGVTSLRLWGSLPSDGLLDLSFSNILDTNAALILAAYDAARGPIDELTIPAIIFAGTSAALLPYFDPTSGVSQLTWHFAQDSPPQVQSVVKDVSSVAVQLVAQLRR